MLQRYKLDEQNRFLPSHASVFHEYGELFVFDVCAPHLRKILTLLACTSDEFPTINSVTEYLN